MSYGPCKGCQGASWYSSELCEAHVARALWSGWWSSRLPLAPENWSLELVKLETFGRQGSFPVSQCFVMFCLLGMEIYGEACLVLFHGSYSLHSFSGTAPNLCYLPGLLKWPSRKYGSSSSEFQAQKTACLLSHSNIHVYILLPAHLWWNKTKDIYIYIKHVCTLQMYLSENRCIYIFICIYIITLYIYGTMNSFWIWWDFRRALKRQIFFKPRKS